MPKCQTIHRKKRRPCVGDLNTLVNFKSRDIQAPEFNAVDFAEDFEHKIQAWAMINTVSGKTYFDGVNTDVNITHEIIIRYDASLTAEDWVEFDDRRIDVVDTEDLDERHEWLLLRCTDKGLKAQGATSA